MSTRRQLRHAQKQNKKQKQLPQEKIQLLLNLYAQGKNLEALSIAKTIIKEFPTSDFGWKALGAILGALGKK
jgi:hypothetical protein